MTLTREQIAGLRAVLAAACAGPWNVCVGKNILVGPIGKAVAVCNYDNGPLEKANARLIAAMHNALPALLDIAEAVANAKVVEIGDSDVEFWPILDGMQGQRVAVLPLAGESRENG